MKIADFLKRFFSLKAFFAALLVCSLCFVACDDDDDDEEDEGDSEGQKSVVVCCVEEKCLGSFSEFALPSDFS